MFDELGLTMENVFDALLKESDRKKMEKGNKQKTKDGKIIRRKGFLKKFVESHREQMDDSKIGKMYGSGVTLKQQRNAQRNSPLLLKTQKEHRITFNGVHIIRTIIKLWDAPV